MNNADRAILVGMVLGDGYIKTVSAQDKRMGRHPAAQITFSHSAKQAVYARHKIERLNKMFGGKASLGFSKTVDSNGNEHQMCYANKSNPYFKTLKGMMYSDGVKVITRRVLDMLSPEGIAYWFMDDGSYRINRKVDGNVGSVSLTISTYVTRDETDDCIRYFNEKHGITFKPAFCKRTKLWYLRCNTGNSRLFAKLIGKYLIPEMMYKLSCIESLDRHERLAPDKTCIECNRVFIHLVAKKLCGSCYKKQYRDSLGSALCVQCKETKPRRHFVGDRCSVCYQRSRRAMI